MSNQVRGLKSKRNGQRFERLVERSCIDYKKRKEAFIQKTPEAMRPLRPMGNGKFISVFEKKSQPDFQGTLWKGRSVVFEAKHTDSTNIRFDRLADHQEAELLHHAELGAEAFILVSFSARRFYKVPIKDWINYKETLNKKSMNEDNLSQHVVRLMNGYIKFLD